MKILVVDEDRISRMLLKRLLDNEGHEVVEAANGTDALKRYLEEPAEVVFVDRGIRDIGGIDLVRKIRERDRKFGTPSYIIMVGEERGRSDMLYALESGVDDFVAKPYDPHILLDRLKMGQWELDPLGEGERRGTGAADILIHEHGTLRKIMKILEVIRGDIGNGIPSFVLEWATSMAAFMTLEYHEEKEYLLIDTLVDNILTEHHGGFEDIARSSFDEIRQQHEELETHLNKIRGDLSRYFKEEKVAQVPVEVLMSELRDIKTVDGNMEEFLDGLEGRLGRYVIDHQNTAEPLKESIGDFVDLLRTHLALEERSFFPFTRRYIDAEDDRRLVEAFGNIDAGGRKARIATHIREIHELLSVLKGEGRGRR